jgi:hypothetical protein
VGRTRAFVPCSEQEDPVAGVRTGQRRQKGLPEKSTWSRERSAVRVSWWGEGEQWRGIRVECSRGGAGRQASEVRGSGGLCLQCWIGIAGGERHVGGAGTKGNYRQQETERGGIERKYKKTENWPVRGGGQVACRRCVVAGS